MISRGGKGGIGNWENNGPGRNQAATGRRRRMRRKAIFLTTVLKDCSGGREMGAKNGTKFVCYRWETKPRGQSQY